MVSRMAGEPEPGPVTILQSVENCVRFVSFLFMCNLGLYKILRIVRGIRNEGGVHVDFPAEKKTGRVQPER